MYSRLLKPTRGKSFFLFGPRGTGKTTWVKSMFPDAAVYLDLLEAEVFTTLLANPQRLESYIPVGLSQTSSQTPQEIIIDEVQRVPALLNEVHRLVEKSRYTFVLTGSSARKLRKGGENLLAGRALTYKFHPLSAVEMGSDFDIKKSLLYGLMPAVFTEPNPQKYLESYVHTYLEEEVAHEGLTRNLSAFARFLETISLSQGSLLNLSGVGRDASVERKTVEQYVHILESLLIGQRLYPFTKRAQRDVVAHPKFYFFDVGVYRAIRPAGPLDIPEVGGDGIAVESLFFQNLLAVNDGLDLGYDFSYYRTTTGLEVDFVAYGPRGMHAFEVKQSDRLSTSMFRGLHAFSKDYPESKNTLVYGGTRRMREGSIDIVPIVEALKGLPELLE